MSFLDQVHDRDVSQTTQQLLGELIQPSQYVGEVFSLGYETALVQIHDFHRQKVGGIPGLSFLVASRIDPQAELNPIVEDCAVILLRVIDAAPLPNENEAVRIRAQTAQIVSGEVAAHWDEVGAMDAHTHNLLSFAGIRCRVIGTFYVDTLESNHTESKLVLHFGSDISNYYPNRGLKVYKPNSSALAKIVNYRDPRRIDATSGNNVQIGEVRYASTNRSFQGINNVPVRLNPADLLGQKTALFGMTRTGKSNTTKIILKSIFELRVNGSDSTRIGQLVLDPNGEYANENVQDNNNAIRNVWRSGQSGAEGDVVTYGIVGHPNDPGRKMMLLNFYLDENLDIGKEIIDSFLSEQSSHYVQNFRQVRFMPPAEDEDHGQKTRYARRVLVYRSLLSAAGFETPAGMNPQAKGLFSEDIREAMKNSDLPRVKAAAQLLGSSELSWDQSVNAFKGLAEFTTTKNSGFEEFDRDYARDHRGNAWADEDLRKILGMFAQANGPRQIGKAKPFHSRETSMDFAESIYQDLVAGRMVIIDQATGEPEVNKASAERIMWTIFRGNQKAFRAGESPPDIVVYVEEAHNLLPEGSEKDLQDVWVRTAKEGAKYNLGLVYATQEVSSIQKNILKNTANWFIGHLNNTDETKELCKYYDFADFQNSILRADDRGFVRVKTLSNKFVVPVQAHRFAI
jgi:hypothetical protein